MEGSRWLSSNLFGTPQKLDHQQHTGWYKKNFLRGKVSATVENTENNVVTLALQLLSCTAEDSNKPKWEQTWRQSTFAKQWHRASWLFPHFSFCETRTPSQNLS